MNFDRDSDDEIFGFWIVVKSRKRERVTGRAVFTGKLADTPCSVFIKRSVAAHSFGKHKKRTQPHDGMTKFSLVYIFIMRLSLQLCSDWILFWQR